MSFNVNVGVHTYRDFKHQRLTNLADPIEADDGVPKGYVDLIFQGSATGATGPAGVTGVAGATGATGPAADGSLYVLKTGDRMSGDLSFTGTNPQVRFFSTTAAEDNRTWQLCATGTHFQVRTSRDNGSSSFYPTALDFDCDSGNASLLKFNTTAATTFQYTGQTKLEIGSNLRVQGPVDMYSNPISNLPEPTAANEPATKNYTDSGLAAKLNLTGGTLTGNLTEAAAEPKFTLFNTSAASNAKTWTMSSTGAHLQLRTCRDDGSTAFYPVAIDLLADDGNVSVIRLNASSATTLRYAGQDKLEIGSNLRVMGPVEMNSNVMTGLPEPTSGNEPATKNYADTGLAAKLNLSGGTLTGNLTESTADPTLTLFNTSADSNEKKWRLRSEAASRQMQLSAFADGAIGTNNVWLSAQRATGSTSIENIVLSTYEQPKLTINASDLVLGPSTNLSLASTGKIVNMATGSAAADAVRYDQVVKTHTNNTIRDSGGANTSLTLGATGAGSYTAFAFDLSNSAGAVTSENLASLQHRNNGAHNRTILISGESPFPRGLTMDRNGADWSTISLNASLAATGVVQLQTAGTNVLKTSADRIDAYQNIVLASGRTLTAAASNDVVLNAPTGRSTVFQVNGVNSLSIGSAGITFSVGSQTALSKYYESTYSPTIGDVAGTFTTSTNAGYYTQVGNVIQVVIDLAWSSKGTAGSGDVRISLPFAVASITAHGLCGSTNAITNTSGFDAYLSADVGNSFAWLQRNASAASPVRFVTGDLGASHNLKAQITYRV